MARECVEDLAADGIVYAEVRFAPELHIEAGLRLDEVVEAVLDGFADGMAAAEAAGRPIVARVLLTAMRTAARSLEIAELAVALSRPWRGRVRRGRRRGRLPADPPPRRVPVRAAGELPRHAARGRGLRPAVDLGGAAVVQRRAARARRTDHRRHHARPGRRAPSSGSLAGYIRDRRIPLEICPTSNVHTGAAPSLAEHPIGLLRRLRFRVTVNTDNRLMSGVTLSSELARCCEAFGWGWSDLEWLTINAMKSAFWPFDDRLALITTKALIESLPLRGRSRPEAVSELYASADG